jgi:hypothetical protein
MKALGIASPASLVAAAVAAAMLAPVAGAKDAESGQACAGPEMVARTCHPSPESWPPPMPPGVKPGPGVCSATGPTTEGCGRRAAGLARAAPAGTASPASGAWVGKR